MAQQGGQQLFTLPSQPVPINGPVRLFYNRARGPLPEHSELVLKGGFNRWEVLKDWDLKRVDMMQRSHDQDWWEVTLDLPDDIFCFDYVMFDKRSGQYDNNNAKDFRLDLTGCPSEQQVLERRLEAYQEFESQRLRFLEAENARLWRQVELAALEAASGVRLEFRRKREVQLRAMAQQMVAERRRPELQALTTRAYIPGVLKWVTPPTAGKKALLAYNMGRGPLSGCNSVRLHLGYDGWWNQVKAEYDLAPMSNDDMNRHGLRQGVDGNHHWFACLVDVPHSGAVLDYVFSDRDQRNWDNNEYQDYHTTVEGAHTGAQLAELMYTALKRDNEAADQVAEDVAAKRACRKVQSRGEALKRRRSSMNQFLYTVPYLPVAGQKMEVFYNPEHTPLRGRPDIYLRTGWNRWSLNRHQPVPSYRMEPVLPGNIGFYRAEVLVPNEAWSADMVFIDTADPQQATGFFDNNGGLDYHIPVRAPNASGSAANNLGALTAMPLVHTPLKVIHVAVEMAPIAKVGGMGDVVTALGRAVQEEGHSVECIIPKYDSINYSQVEQLRQEGGFAFGGTNVRVWKGIVDGLPTTFLEPENGHFWRGCIYGRNDDSVRFGFFCGAALQYLKTYNVQPSIIHCHDWPSAPVAWGDRMGAKCIFTIHNLSYGADLVARAMAACDVATTVSPTYAQEISGHSAVAPHLGKLYGIRNGIDTDVWDPSSDPHLPVAYSPDAALEGKDAARRALRSKLNLSQIDVPIVGCVTRLVAQKGIHLIKHAAWRTLERGAQFVLLGSAPDGRVQGEFNALRDQLKAQYHDRAALIFQYDEPLSHQIYAGCDMFLVPSIFEPCGLTQMIAMQYGTVPVVRKTGGLADTVFDVDHEEQRAAAAGMETNGFVFESVDAAGMDYALNRALSMWYSDKAGWRQLVHRVMRQDWSWYSPALDYVELYYKAMRS
ncbi:starch synthase [Haematococcus lacustris]